MQYFIFFNYYAEYIEKQMQISSEFLPASLLKGAMMQRIKAEGAPTRSSVGEMM